MATRLEKHRERLNALSLLGRDLTRRAGSKCELCEAAGVKLQPYEVEPVPAEPELDHCLFICETCSHQLDNPKQIDANHWRCLGKSMWSEVPAVQVTSILMLRRLAPLEWAEELLEQAYLSDEVEQWLASVS